MIAPGVLLSDRYRLTSRIAVGGMGEVWAAQDTRLGRTVAVKILRSEFTGDPEFVDRFRAEARMTASLNHPGIAAIYDYGETDLAVGSGPDGRPHQTAYLVMELVAGEPLSAVLPRVRRLSPARTLDVVEQTGRALHAAHLRNLVHRDVKPGNLLITPNGQVKVTDFGIAKVAHQAPVTRTGMVMGTAHYISPEQAAGEEAVPASDIYSLGVVAYECLAGRLPFLADTTVGMAMAHVRDEPPPLPSDVPAPIVALVGHMMVKDPQQRFPDGAALCAGIAQIRASAHAVSPGRSATSGPTTRTFARPPATSGATRTDRPAVARPARSPAARVAPSSPPAVVSAAPRARPTTAPPRVASPAVRSAPRRTAVATLLALLVLLLAVLAVVTVDLRLVGGSSVDHALAVLATGTGARS